MEIRLDSKVALITGASRGIGQELVRQFARSGAKVVFCARRTEPLKVLEALLKDQGCDVIAIAADVTRKDHVAELIFKTLDHFGQIDVLVNNAGVAGPTKAIEDTALSEWNEVLAANLTSAFLCVRASVPAMRASGGGSIINIGSATGKRPLAHRIAYATAKTGMIGLTRTAAEELGPHKIRVNCICPGAVAGERLDEIMAGQADLQGISTEQFRQSIQAQTPLRQLVDAEDVARLALFLASKHSKNMTGQDINVTAGMVMY